MSRHFVNYGIPTQCGSALLNSNIVPSFYMLIR